MIEPHSQTWRALDERLNAELSKLMTDLKNEKLDETSTTRVRARIRAFEDVLSWAVPVNEPPIEGSTSWQV